MKWICLVVALSVAPAVSAEENVAAFTRFCIPDKLEVADMDGMSPLEILTRIPQVIR